MALTTSSVQIFGLKQSEVRALDQAADSVRGALLPDPIAATAMTVSAFAVQPDLPSNVVGVGIGSKINTSGAQVPSIHVLVRHKVGPDALSSGRLIPETISGFPTSVVETGEIAALFNKHFSPVPAGVSIGNCTLSMAGTLGCFVTEDQSPGQPLILSNNHVLALVNSSLPGTTIPQPGLLDGGACPAAVIASLKRFHPINFGSINLIDAAIADVSRSAATDQRVLRNSAGTLFDKLVGPHVAPALGMLVQKSGRTTGHTTGVITLVGTSVNVNMGSPTAPSIARFDQQFQVVGSGTVFSRPGDSGSLVTTLAKNQPSGLLFAGGGGNTFCNDIGNVLTIMGLSILY